MFFYLLALHNTHPHTHTHTHTQPEDTEATSTNSVGRSEVKAQSILRRSKRKKKENQDFVFLDRRSLILNTDEVRQYPEAKTLMSKEASPDTDKALAGRVHDMEITHKAPRKVGVVNNRGRGSRLAGWIHKKLTIEYPHQLVYIL